MLYRLRVAHFQASLRFLHQAIFHQTPQENLRPLCKVHTVNLFKKFAKNNISSFNTSTRKQYCIMAENRYIVGYAKLGTSSCKKCKQKINKGGLRIGKLVSNPFGDDGGDMKQWFHPPCIFETFVRARATTKKIEEPDDMEGFPDLQQEDKDVINKLIKEFMSKQKNKTPSKKSPAAANKKTGVTPTKLKMDTPTKDSDTKADQTDSPSTSAVPIPSTSDVAERDNSFREFRRLCADIAEENSYTGKTQFVINTLKNGRSGGGFEGDVYLLIKLLLPGVVKTVYNLNNKQLVKHFSQIFGMSLEEMVTDLEQGDVAETVRKFFEEDGSKILPQKKSKLSLAQVDSMLTELSKETKEDDQQRELTKMAKLCTANDMKMVIRLIKHDLRINAGAKHILDGLDPNAYAAFQTSRNLRDVVDRVMENRNHGDASGMKKTLSVRASLMTPVLPMLAEACRSVEQAMKKCPNGFYAEIKYDGERVQVHKKGTEFQYFSRSLKPVLPHKVAHFKDYIPKAFPSGNDLILDAEVLLVDTKTSQPLPFGTLGVHKKAAFSDANVCLFIFDCLHINGENLMNKPIKDRRQYLHDNMTEIPNRIMFSEMEHMTKREQLQKLMTKVFREGLEGLVLKDILSIYEPGKRHWLKVKKDYLNEGSMADSADLVVLGAYYGTGNKGGLMSVFLTGVYNPGSKKWCTVTKVGNGFDDKTLEKLQTELKMVKISKDVNKVPSWLNVKKGVIPDFVSADPKSSPVWEISGAEFSKAEVHTADGISIRFPRVTKVRDDKSWEEATDLVRLKDLVAQSKENSDFPDLVVGKKGKSPDVKKVKTENGTIDDEPSTSPKKTPSKIKHDFDAMVGEPSTSREKTPVKRKIESADNDSASPAKKSRPLCRYGAKCYQTNPGHLDQYDHSGGNEATPAKSKVLLNIFKGMRILLPKSLEKYKELKRYIIAYDGDVVNDYEANTATHIIYGGPDEKPPSGSSGKLLSVDWLTESIRKKQVIVTDHYIVKQ